MNVSRLLSRSSTGYVGAVLLTAAVTGLVAVVRAIADVSNVSMLYLLAVLASAVAFGVGPAIVSSVAAFLAFNYFFLEPRYTFTVSEEEEWVALALLLTAGIVTGRLAGGLSARARQAERRERDAAVLYDVTRLMSEPDLDRALASVAERLRIELDVSAVRIAFNCEKTLRRQADAGDPESLLLANQALGQPSMLLASGVAPTRAARGRPGRWIKVVPPSRRSRRGDRVCSVPISLRGEQMGMLVLVAKPGTPPFDTGEGRLLSVAASQLAATMDRSRLRQEATEAEILRRTDELRTALMGAVSHDLRTPLATIIASAGSLLQRDVEWAEDERREFAEAIEVEAGRLDRLVGNLLDLSRIEAGSLRPEKGWYDLGTLVQETAGRLNRPPASHRLTLSLPSDLPPIYFDYVEIDQVLSNLIDNAFKHTPPGTEVVVSVRPAGQEVEVAVADGGPGIQAGALAHVFDAFYRGPAAGARPAGSGVGLAVARGLVEAHGGRIWAVNRPGGGARFAFTLPLGTGSPPPSSSASEAAL